MPGTQVTGGQEFGRMTEQRYRNRPYLALVSSPNSSAALISKTATTGNGWLWPNLLNHEKTITATFMLLCDEPSEEGKAKGVFQERDLGQNESDC